MDEGVPAQLLGGFDVFGAVVEEEDLGGRNAGDLFEHAVEGGIGFHGPMFEGEDVVLEAFEEGVVGADVPDGEVVGIGEDGGGAVGGLDAIEQARSWARWVRRCRRNEWRTLRRKRAGRLSGRGPGKSPRWSFRRARIRGGAGSGGGDR